MIKNLRIYKNDDDMYQIGLIALWEAWQKYQPDKGSFAALAKQTVRGRLLHELRRQRTYDDRHIFERQTDTEASIFTRQADPFADIPLEADIIHTYIASLSERQQLWVREAIITGKTSKDIASEQHVSTHTVRSWKKAALKNLRKNFLNSV